MVVENYESWLAVDIVIAIITAYFFLGHTAHALSIYFAVY